MKGTIWEQTHASLINFAFWILVHHWNELHDSCIWVLTTIFLNSHLLEFDSVRFQCFYFQKGGVVGDGVGNDQADRLIVNCCELHQVVVVRVGCNVNLLHAHKNYIFGRFILGIVVPHVFGNVEVVEFVLNSKQNVFVPVAD